MLSSLFSLIEGQAPQGDLVNEGIFNFKKKEFSNYLVKLAISMVGLVLWTIISRGTSNWAIVGLLACIVLNLLFSRVDHQNPSTYNQMLILYWVVSSFLYVEYLMSMIIRKGEF